MPKRPKLSEAELHALIVKQARHRLSCEDFAPDFTLRPVEPPGYPVAPPGLALPLGSAHVRANWDIGIARNVERWPPDCAQAFIEAVEGARRKFDIAWP